MTSDAKTVEEYLTQVPQDRRPALEKIRHLCRTHLPEHEEGMHYKLPSYRRNGQVEVSFASQKQHICVYILIHSVMLNNKERLKGINHGKGSIRFPKPDKIDYELIALLLQETAASDETIC